MFTVSVEKWVFRDFTSARKSNHRPQKTSKRKVMISKIPGLKFPFAILIIIIGAHSAFGCMYGQLRTVCEKYAAADLIVIGEIKSVQLGGMTQIVAVRVEKTFKGIAKKSLTISQPRSTCDREFSEGKTLLLYLVFDKTSGKYKEMTPDAGDEKERSSEEIYWLGSLPASLRRTRIAGTVTLYKDNPFEFLSSISSLKITVSSGEKSYNVVTDRNGVYEIWDLPPAKYKILPEFTSKFSLRFTMSKGNVEFKQISNDRIDTENFEVNLTELKCGGADYALK
jgi:hypothetical protein